MKLGALAQPPNQNTVGLCGAFAPAASALAIACRQAQADVRTALPNQARWACNSAMSVAKKLWQQARFLSSLNECQR